MSRLDCEGVRELLPAWQDRELANGEASAVAAHLSGCGGCREDEAALLRAWNAFRARRFGARVPDALGANPYAQPSWPVPLLGWVGLRGGFAAACAFAALAFATRPRACSQAPKAWSPAVEIAAFRDLGAAELVVAADPAPEPVLTFR